MLDKGKLHTSNVTIVIPFICGIDSGTGKLERANGLSIERKSADKTLNITSTDLYDFRLRETEMA